MLRSVAIAIGLVLFAAIAGAMLLRGWWERPLNLPAQGMVLQVEPGDSLSRLSRRLTEKGVLEHGRLLNFMGRLLKADSRILRGEYHVNQGVTPKGLLTLLQSGDTVRYLVTLPEGITLAEGLALIQASEGIRTTLTGPEDKRLQEMVAPATSTEGYFLPETYQYERGASDFDLLAEAHRMMEQTLADVWQQRRTGLPYSKPYEALIMASIIEKETGLASERPTIGGVFVRRLEQGMRLQTDPTVIYGLGEAFEGNLQRRHLNDSSNAYNSYRHHGLPPGPIALPGRAALVAAVNPAPGNALYFVARGDGSHQFSVTLKDHEEAVRRFQLSRRSNYRSAPESKQQ